MRTHTLACSFCGSSAAEVARLIAGPRVFICDACIARCNEILAEHPPAASSPTTLRAPAGHRWWRRLHAWWATPRLSAESSV